MSEHYIAKEYSMSAGVGVSMKRLSSFDKALLDAGVGNYNLVRLSSILPAHCKEVDIKDIANHIKEGALLPTAYSTISSSTFGEQIASAIGVGFPKNGNLVGVIMEYSNVGISRQKAVDTVRLMIKEAFDERGWELDGIRTVASEAIVESEGMTVSTFACIAEW